MIDGIDPMYILMGLVTLLIFVILIMTIILLIMVSILKGIRRETTSTSGSLKALGPRVIGAVNTYESQHYANPRFR